jgi:hypothetical protein
MLAPQPTAPTVPAPHPTAQPATAPHPAMEPATARHQPSPCDLLPPAYRSWVPSALRVLAALLLTVTAAFVLRTVADPAPGQPVKSPTSGEIVTGG